MSEQQHTPSPWRVKPYGARFAVYGAVHPVDGGDYAPLATYLEEADAHLMAAAPELLEACKRLKKLCEEHCDTWAQDYTGACMAAFGAIEKAEQK